MVWRRLRMNGNASLADLHHAIQLSMGWDDTHLHKFRIYAKDYGIHYEGGMSFSDDAHSVYIDHFQFDAGDKFSYEYNFFESRVCDIRVEKIAEATGVTPPYCISGHLLYHEYPVRYPMDILQDIVDAMLVIKKKPTKRSILRIQELLDEYQELKFNKKKINQELLDHYRQAA